MWAFRQRSEVYVLSAATGRTLADAALNRRVLIAQQTSPYPRGL